MGKLIGQKITNWSCSGYCFQSNSGKGVLECQRHTNDPGTKAKDYLLGPAAKLKFHTQMSMLHTQTKYIDNSSYKWTSHERCMTNKNQLIKSKGFQRS